MNQKDISDISEWTDNSRNSTIFLSEENCEKWWSEKLKFMKKFEERKKIIESKKIAEKCEKKFPGN